MTVYEAHVSTPIGALRLYARDAGLTGVYLPEHRRMPQLVARLEPSHPHLRQAASELAEYFAGARRAFTLPLAPEGTAFQRAVWEALRTIPHGSTWTYAALAERVGRPGAARAVGSANARNPLSIVIPCHRVLGSDGAATGYAGGLERKRWLLAHEQRNA